MYFPPQLLSWTMANICLIPDGWIQAKRFYLSSAQMNSCVFLHSGVKLLLYLADRCGLMYSPRSHPLSLYTSPTSWFQSDHTVCDNKRFVRVIVCRNVFKCRNMAAVVPWWSYPNGHNSLVVMSAHLVVLLNEDRTGVFSAHAQGDRGGC